MTFAVEERKQLAGLWQDQGLVFASGVGTPINRHNLLHRSFKPLLEKVGLPHSVRFHDLRHTYATLLLGKGVHPKLVQELLGHATISTTIQRYKTASAAVSRSANRQRRAVARIG